MVKIETVISQVGICLGLNLRGKDEKTYARWDAKALVVKLCLDLGYTIIEIKRPGFGHNKKEYINRFEKSSIKHKELYKKLKKTYEIC